MLKAHTEGFALCSELRFVCVRLITKVFFCAWTVKTSGLRMRGKDRTGTVRAASARRKSSRRR